MHDLTPEDFDIPNGLTLTGVLIEFLPTPQISKKQDNRLWNLAIL